MALDFGKYLTDPLLISFVLFAGAGYYGRNEIRDRINRFDSTITFIVGYMGMMTVYLITSKRKN